MKSTPQQLKNRGYVQEELNKEFQNRSFEELIELLKSNTAVVRTWAARYLTASKNPAVIDRLCWALQKEKKLYTKIELANTLVSFGIPALPALILLLGKIGNNHHKIPVREITTKKSYPLPRDVAARTIIRFGTCALPFLKEVLLSGNADQMSEAIDAIGHLCFYNRNEKYLPFLIHCYRNADSDLIKWKLIRSMCSFPDSAQFLDEITDQTKNEVMNEEIIRIQKILLDKRFHMTQLKSTPF